MTRDEATQRQIDAADPAVSTWLSANAGSGKTRVLTDRVARLLLDGVSPQNILCLTYTKAAASEMQNRLFRRLGEWSMKNDGDLVKELDALGAANDLNPEKLRHARTLFARALETPGGLKIQTIHSFCASLLRRFPLEAGVSPFFKEMEDRAAKMLRQDVVEELSDGPNAHVVVGLAAHTNEELDFLTAEIVKHREPLSNTVSQADIWEQFGLPAGFEEAMLLDSVFVQGEKDLLSQWIPLLRTGGITDCKNAEKLAAVDAGNPTLRDLNLLIDLFLTGATAKSPFTAKIGSLPTKALRAANPDLTAELDALMARVETARETRNQLGSAQKTYALRKFALAFLSAYEAKKLDRGWLDFDDLILLARKLLTDPNVAQWVLFRLDGGIDHILVDEAQDTSPRQWQVIERLAQEFTAGQGARPDATRTIFVVGDLKQSIYSFQGADPKAFDAMRRHFETQLVGSGSKLFQRSLDYSFRSSRAVLGLVDATFDQVNGRGVGGKPTHLTFKEFLPGRVDLWPMIPSSDAPDERKWYDTTDKIASNDHRILLAHNIADEIATLIESGSIPDNNGAFRKIRPGDFLILVQKRSPLFHEIIRACKSRQLPIAGADRLKVGAELAVKDISALLSFLATQDDDLSLAAALRSPLFGWSESELFDLAHGRPEPRLWGALLHRRSEFPKTYKMLFDLQNMADFLGPFELIERILTRYKGRDLLLARLGTEAEDGIDALISQAVSYERSETPSLTGFISWLESDEVEIKRQADGAGDRIRVMTTHGAKGLEAPIVILPDTGKQKGKFRDQIVALDSGNLVWKSAAGNQTTSEALAISQIKDAQEEERLRLLYVALTRAEKWLIVCGSGEPDKSGSSWYDLVQAGMTSAGATKVDLSNGPILRLEHGIWQNQTDPYVPQASPEPQNCPLWANSAAPLPVKKPSTLSPSELGGPKTLPGETGPDEAAGRAAIEKGTQIHLLLEHLPAHPRSAWDSISMRLLKSLDTAPETIAQTKAEAFAVLEDPALAHIFGPDTLAEVVVSANISDLNDARIHGAIDRLVILPDRVLCVDFKSNAIVPQVPGDVPTGLLRQMAAYWQVLARIYPEKAVDVAILWTQNASLMQLPHDIVRSAIQDPLTP